MKTVLLVIDIQNLLVDSEPYAIEERVSLWQETIAACRQKGLEVIYVRHNDEEFIPQTQGWEISSLVAPSEQEKIFDNHYNSAFKDTGLHAYLQQEGVGRLILIGMSTNYCIDATVKVAFELGYEVAVVEHGTTTFADPDIATDILIDYHEIIWDQCFAQVDDLETILKGNL